VHPPAPTYKRADVMWRLGETPSATRIATNNLGEHNRQVFGGMLGLSDAEIDALLDAGIIGDEYKPGAEVDRE
jgi:hypothetical protein